uniref:Putative kazal domain-containing peptide n=1 Tax=Corethrella appendiculata TaxID=1370023 RepID=U5EP46_9DIPT
MKFILFCGIVLTMMVIITPSNAEICPCPRIYMPVCGTNLRTYSNACELRCEADTVQGRSIHLRQAHEGECEHIKDQSF